MRNHFLAFFCILFLVSICNAQSDTATNTAQTAEINNPVADEIDEVLIIGEQPGPSLWRVYKDDHVLWILGSFGPLPKKLKWHSHQAEAALINSQELLLYPFAKPKLGFFTQISMLPSFIGIKKNPDGARLEDVVPADTYTRWLALKEKYIGSDSSVEKYRPIFAGNELLEQALNKVGLNAGDLALEKVQKIAKKNNIKTTVPTVIFEMKQPKQIVKNFKQAAIDDVTCFNKMLDHLETDLDNTRLRANAWAIGDLEALSKLPITDHGSTCFQAVMNASFMDEESEIKNLPAALEEEWLVSVEHALTNNAASFAIVETHEILKPDGLLTKLKTKGYRVEGFGFDALQSQ
jgi:hypothetical protein